MRRVAKESSFRVTKAMHPPVHGLVADDGSLCFHHTHNLIGQFIDVYPFYNQ